jgi:hypothetical protein
MVPNADSSRKELNTRSRVGEFVFRPFQPGWIQPFVWFTTKGGAPGTVCRNLF